MTSVQHARSALADLRKRFDWLEDNLLNGTPRPYRAPHLSLEARHERDAQARAERHERVNIAPGDSPDPFSFDVMDLRDTILTTADAMAEQVAHLAEVDAMPDASWGDSAGLWLVFAAHWLEKAASHSDRLCVDVERKCWQLIQRADVLLGHVTDGQTLDVPCFVCDSADERHPTGGGRTLRYRKQHTQHSPEQLCGAWCRDYVVCEGGRCAPSTEQCGYRFRGHPAWDLKTESDWLGDRLGVVPADVPRCVQCNEPVASKRRKFCSDGCRQAAYRDRLVEQVRAA